MKELNLNKIITEQVNKKTRNIDGVNTLSILKMINNEDAKVALAVKKVLGDITKAVDIIYQALLNGGRLIYVGAGTSGRLGVLDASEMPPTFGVNKNMIIGIIAGGNKALKDPAEGAEDNQRQAIIDLQKNKLSKLDVLVGISASGRTPYVQSALLYANKIGAHTVSISTNKNADISKIAKIKIEAITGPEVITGSTRMKSGTAQKLILNMLTTGTMIKLGKVYGNLMVDVVPTNAKLMKRSHNIVKQLTGASSKKIDSVMKITQNKVKPAVVMIKKQISYSDAQKLLNKNNGLLKKTLK